MNDWYDSFLETLYKKYPKKSQLTEALMDLLAIERESVYRRLRKDIVFPTHEIAKIAFTWNISLNEIVGIRTGEIVFKTQLWNYLNPSDEELNAMRFFSEDSEYTRNFPNMECMEISNRLPRMVITGFPYLSRFYLLKWNYQYCNEEALPFSQLMYPDEVAQLSENYYMVSKNLGTVSFILDHNVTNEMVSDIRYFHSIYLISDEEKELIKKDLYASLDYMTEVAAKGCWPETGNKVNLYISHLSIDTNYSYYHSDIIKFCCVHAFGKNEIWSRDEAMVENFINWMQSKKRAAVLISESDERSRIEFFMKQREIIDGL
ncbi:MAG: hypothetical protein FWC39_07225 [Bacteroidetes bacterium]|nr:hypothetical protein [Bacteroidota bacterium]